MELTPVKVRGKRRRRGQPKRPAAVWPAQKARGKADRVKHRQRKPARLQNMPVEILEEIFLLSENLNFPRSHSWVGCRLSSHSTLVKLIITALGPTWDQWFGCVADNVQSYPDWDKDLARFAGNPAFQTAVLSCAWAKLPLILEACDMWYAKEGGKRYFEHICDPCDELQHRNGGHDHVDSVAECFRVDWLMYYNKAQHPLTIYPPYRRRHRIEVHPQVRIPDRLLTGPFTSENVAYLYWFVRAGARLSPSHNWESTLQGFLNVLELEDDLLVKAVIELFGKLGVFLLQWPIHVLEEAMNSVNFARWCHGGPRGIDPGVLSMYHSMRTERSYSPEVAYKLFYVDYDTG